MPATSYGLNNDLPLSRTQLRKAQRHYAKLCYLEAKRKLVNMLVPTPQRAIHALDLEKFRSDMYGGGDVAESEELAPSPRTGASCFWCGVWKPLPPDSGQVFGEGTARKQHAGATTGELGNQPTVPTNVAVAEPGWPESDPTKNKDRWVNIGELGNQPTVTTPRVAVAAPCWLDSDPDKNEPDAMIKTFPAAEAFSPLVHQLEAVSSIVDALLEGCLCQAPCELEELAETEVPLTTDEHHGKQGQSNVIAAAALTTPGTCEPIYRLKRYCFKRTRICEVPETEHISLASQPILPVAPQYYTEESTGECKTQ